MWWATEALNWRFLCEILNATFLKYCLFLLYFVLKMFVINFIMESCFAEASLCSDWRKSEVRLWFVFSELSNNVNQLVIITDSANTNHWIQCVCVFTFYSSGFFLLLKHNMSGIVDIGCGRRETVCITEWPIRQDLLISNVWNRYCSIVDFHWLI